MPAQRALSPVERLETNHYRESGTCRWMTLINPARYSSHSAILPVCYTDRITEPYDALSTVFDPRDASMPSRLEDLDTMTYPGLYRHCEASDPSVCQVVFVFVLVECWKSRGRWKMVDLVQDRTGVAEDMYTWPRACGRPGSCQRVGHAYSTRRVTGWQTDARCDPPQALDYLYLRSTLYSHYHCQYSRS